MFGAIYVGLSGLQAYSKGLQEISNNVSNLNSSGFKASSIGFSDLVTGSSQGLSGNALGTGNGVSLSFSRTDFSQGELRQSEGALDLAVDGSGMLVLLDGNEQLYMRTGRFEVNEDGDIVLAGTDFRLAVLNDAGQAVALNIDGKRTSVPELTTNIRFADNLSSTGTSYNLPDVRVYDANGGEHVWQIAFARDADAGAGIWDVTITDGTGTVVGTQELRFLQGSVDPATAKLVFADQDKGLSVTLDFSSGVTSFSSGEVSTLRAAAVDGHGTGTIATIRVNAQGAIEIGYSNQQTEILGDIALADFRDMQGLTAIGTGLYRFEGSGERILAASSDPRVGRVLGNRIEASNVDLSGEFGNLILIQRGFQASSQIVSASNDMIQQLFGIRGQG